MATASLRWGALAIGLALLQTSEARAQWGYGWGGYGGGSTVQGDMARGMGALAVGAGVYNQQTAVANSINADTAARWNQYLYLSQQEANRKYQARMAQKRYKNAQGREQVADRLRNNPEKRDIYSGDALNVAFDEINNPRIYSKTLAAAKVKIGGETIRDIPFQYAAAAISTSIHQIARGGPPPSLKRPEFDAERAEMRKLATAIRAKTDEGEDPDPADVKKALKVVEDIEVKVAKVYPDKNSRERVEAEKHVKAVHGLLRMMETPALNILLAGAEKRPQATLGDLLTFMNAFNLRFGKATTPVQQQVYDTLYPKLVQLRSQIAPALAGVSPTEAEPAAEDASGVFARMSTEDLKKKTPPPPAAQP